MLGCVGTIPDAMRHTAKECFSAIDTARNTDVWNKLGVS